MIDGFFSLGAGFLSSLVSTDPPWQHENLAEEGGGSKQFRDKSGQIIRVFPKMGVPQNGWSIMENSIKMDDLGVPLFFWFNTHKSQDNSDASNPPPSCIVSKEISTARPPKNCFLAKRAAQNGHGTCNQVAKDES